MSALPFSMDDWVGVVTAGTRRLRTPLPRDIALFSPGENLERLGGEKKE